MDARRMFTLARPLAGRLSRRATFLGLPAVASMFGTRVAAQDGRRVGMASPGQSSFEFVGRVDQTGMDLTFHGYLTHVSDVDDAILFTESDPFARSESGARITMVGSATGFSRSVLNGVFIVNADGMLRFLFNDQPGVSFATPESFATGDEICALAIRVQSVINVYAPQMGLSTGYCDAVVDSTAPFALEGETVEIGEVGTFYRLSFTGLGQLLNPEEQISVISIAGNGTVAG